MSTTSPAGGYFVALDGDFQTSPLMQMINGLMVGDKYDVNFWWATSQRIPTTESQNRT